MNSLKNKFGLINVLLLLPALFFCAAATLVVGFKLEVVNDLLDLLTTHRVFRLFFLPVVMLGGPAVAFALSALSVLRVSAEVIHDEFVIALSIKRLFSHLACAAVAGGLILLMLTYGFVENFRIVPTHQ